MIKHQEQTTRPQAAETLVTHPPHPHSSHLAQTHSQAEAKTPPHHPRKTPTQAVAEKTLPHRAPVNSRGTVHRIPVSLLRVTKEEERARPSPLARKSQTRKKKRKRSLYSLDKLTRVTDTYLT
ncbi:hypothetical protein KAT55_09080, partial [Candidatus Bathyarchaeota archaeon]|nr:hypothetical protein [Candidatus Bathyarchaeota archaeon]